MNSKGFEKQLPPANGFHSWHFFIRNFAVSSICSHQKRFFFARLIQFFCHFKDNNNENGKTDMYVLFTLNPNCPSHIV